jgi:cytochrome b561
MLRLDKSVMLLLTPIALSPMAFAAEMSPSTPPGWMPHFESLIALAVVLVAFATAYFLNHAAPKRRALGTGLAALSCFAIVAWFGWVLASGVIESPKPHQAPMDGLKPMLLWAQAATALIAGGVLLRLAIRQFAAGAQLNLSGRNEAHRYGRVSRFLHWSTALLFIFMIPTGIFASMIPEDAWYRTEYNVVHKTIGLTIFGLVLARLFWNRRSPRPALDAALKPVERKLAHSAHVLLYGLLIAIPVTGYMMTSLHGYSTFFFTLEIPSFLPESQAYIVWGLFHKYVLQYLVYIILGAHILGALKHQFIDKHDSAFKRMVS